MFPSDFRHYSISNVELDKDEKGNGCDIAITPQLLKAFGGSCDIRSKPVSILEIHLDV
jgi:hypothetical protein